MISPAHIASAKLPATATWRSEFLPRGCILLVSLGVVTLSTLLSLGSESHQVMLPLVNRPLPPLCSWKSLTGVDCPGCGLTRSFIALAHGQWRESLRFNPAGPIW